MIRARILRLPLLSAILVAAPIAAQDHSAHQAPVAKPATEHPAQDDPHAAHTSPIAAPVLVPTDPHADHAASPGAAEPPQDPHAGHDRPPQAGALVQAGTMDQMGHMDHNMMDHSGAEPSSPGPEVEAPPPSEVGSGPPRAADAIWGAAAMRASREDLKHHGDFPLFWFQADRAEVRVRDGDDGYLWDVQGYYGGPTSRFWFKSEGEGSFGEDIEDAEVQALYARAIAPFFDVQAGVRQDLGGRDTTYAVVSIQGTAPYMFELDGALFLSHRGDLTARLEAELDQRITQRFIIQPRVEVHLAAQDVEELGIGAGIDTIEAGVRLRYEIARELAPYVGIEQSWRLGQGADFARAAGGDPSATNFVAGIRFWF